MTKCYSELKAQQNSAVFTAQLKQNKKGANLLSHRRELHKSAATEKYLSTKKKCCSNHINHLLVLLIISKNRNLNRIAKTPRSYSQYRQPSHEII